jgi:septation ring formation regulator EzrA
MESFKEAWDSLQNYAGNEKLIERYNHWRSHNLDTVLKQDILTRINHLEKDLEGRIEQQAKSLELTEENFGKFQEEVKQLFYKMRDSRLKHHKLSEKREIAIRELNNSLKEISDLIENYKNQNDTTKSLQAGFEIKNKIHALDNLVSHLQSVDNFLDHFWNDFESHLQTIQQKYANKKASQDMKMKGILDYVAREISEIESLMQKQ